MEGTWSEISQAVSLIFSLIGVVLVLVLTYFATRWFARRAGAGAASGRAMHIVDRVTVAQGAHLLIVEVGGAYYLLGVGDKNVNLITKLDDFRLDATPAANTPPSFRDLLQDMLPARGKTQGKKGNGGDFQ